jgi:hypothetical protein
LTVQGKPCLFESNRRKPEMYVLAKTPAIFAQLPGNIVLIMFRGTGFYLKRSLAHLEREVHLHPFRSHLSFALAAFPGLPLHIPDPIGSGA